MKDKVILITGATSGIGKVAATELASMGATVIIHGRNREKAESVKKEIIEKCGHDRIDIVIADMASLNDVRQMAADVKMKYNHLEILLNNAGGVMKGSREITVDGLERTFAVNVASLFLLTALLFDLLRKSQDGRIISTSSIAHKFGKLQLEDLQSEKKYSSTGAYGAAKLQVIAFTEELVRRMKEAGIGNVTANTLHPGVVSTNFAQESNGSVMRFFFRAFGFLFISPEKGARTSVFLASSDSVKEHTGMYFSRSRPAKVRRRYLSDSRQKEKLWSELEDICKVKFPFS